VIRGLASTREPSLDDVSLKLEADGFCGSRDFRIQAHSVLLPTMLHNSGVFSSEQFFSMYGNPFLAAKIYFCPLLVFAEP
jgi:hypothetical protein